MRLKRWSNRRSKIDQNETDALADDGTLCLFVGIHARDGQPPGPITRQKYSVRPIGPSRSPPIICGRRVT